MAGSNCSPAEILPEVVSLVKELSSLTKTLKSKPYNDIYDPVRPSGLKKAIDISMPNFSGHE